MLDFRKVVREVAPHAVREGIAFAELRVFRFERFEFLDSEIEVLWDIGEKPFL